MCGIVGYVGEKNALPVLLDGLKHLEYRGYDSAGFALHSGNDFVIRRKAGPVQALVDASLGLELASKQGISHTRWATHGEPSEMNAHPHRAGNLVIVHNGIVENHARLKERLIREGVSFASQTDTEVFVQLVEFHRKSIRAKNSEDSNEQVLIQALRQATIEVEGHYAVLIMDREIPGRIFGIQNGAPLVASHRSDGYVIASDIQAIESDQKQVCFLPTGEVFVASAETLSANGLRFENFDGAVERAERGGFESFMMKEIFEQPRVAAETLKGRIPIRVTDSFHWENSDAHSLLWKNTKRLVLVACGTSYHAALTAKYLFERDAKIECQVDIASEFRYRDPVFSAGTAVGVISQSGETADTLAALRLAHRSGIPTFSICNVASSTLVRESELSYLTRAGAEVGVASTKAFTAQLSLLCALATDVAKIRERIPNDAPVYDSLARLPSDLDRVLTQSERLLSLGEELKDRRMILFVGRGTMYPIALEGALKFKELTYLPAEGFAAGELKHGPIAYIDRQTTVIALIPKDEWHAKTLSNLEEIRARGGRIIAVGTEGDSETQALADVFVALPESAGSTRPILAALPLQLLAYGCARALGRNIDRPRNLAKSVTVE